MKERFKWTLRALGATPILIIITVVVMGVGHGPVWPLVTFFPGALVLQSDNDNIYWAWLLFQFPVYGLIIDLTIRKSYAAKIIIGIALVHFIFFFIALFQIRA